MMSFREHNQIFNKKAFTLIEMILYVSLVSTMLFVIVSFLSLILQSRIKNQSIAEVDQQGIQVMQIVTQTIRNAIQINSPSLGASGSSLSINVVSAPNNPTIFDLSSGTIRITEGASSPVSLTSNRITASNLTFQNLSPNSTGGSIRITFTLSQKNPGSKNEYDFTKTFYDTATLR